MRIVSEYEELHVLLFIFAFATSHLALESNKNTQVDLAERVGMHFERESSTLFGWAQGKHSDVIIAL